MSNLVTMMGRVKKLKNGAGVQSLLDGAYKILGNPIVMFNTEYNLIAHTETVTDDPIWNEIVTNGTFSKETQIFFENEGFVEEIANSSKVVLLSSKKLKYDRYSGKLFNRNNSFVSNLVLVSCGRPFEEYDQMVFEAVCKLVSREISRSDSYQEYEQAHQETVIKNLIDGNYDKKLDMGQVGILYDSLESRIYLAVADVSQSSLQCGNAHCGAPECSRIVYFRDLLKQAAPGYKYAVYDNRVVIIISTNDEVLDVGKELRGLIEVFRQNDMYVGISSGFENLFELQKYYTQALESMHYALSAKCDQVIYPYCESARDKMRRIENLVNGEGIQYFLNEGADILGNPLLFHDMEPNLLGCTENAEIIDPIWQELITYGTGSDETVELFRTAGWVDIMDKTKGGSLLVSEKCKYDRISWRIYNSENIRFGCTSIVNTMKPFSEDELVLFGVFSQKFSKEVGKIDFYNKYGQFYSETIINRLISGKIDDYGFYSEDSGNLYDTLMENLYLIVVDTSQCESEEVNLSYCRKLFNWPGAVNRYAIYGEYIIIIVSIDSEPLGESERFIEINKAFEQKNIYAGVSSCFENLCELQKYYLEAVDALKNGLKNREKGSSRRFF